MKNTLSRIEIEIGKWYRECIYIQQINSCKDKIEAKGYSKGSWLGAKSRLGKVNETIRHQILALLKEIDKGVSKLRLKKHTVMINGRIEYCCKCNKNVFVNEVKTILDKKIKEIKS